MSSLLSRYAESVFWMARYFERAESLARVLETQTSFQRGCGENSWAWIVALYSDEKAFANAFGEEAERGQRDPLLYGPCGQSGVDPDQRSGRPARTRARSGRCWRSTCGIELNDFYNRLCAFGPSDFSEVRLSRTCDAIKRGCYAQLGVAESTLLPRRDLALLPARPIPRTGRPDQPAARRALRAASRRGLARDEGRYDFTFWTILLRAASAYHSYRRIFPRHIDPEEVARFLLFDARMPRSLAFCLLEIQAMIDLLRRNFGLRNAAAPAEKIEAMIVGLDAARRDQRLLDSLHNFNDWIQLSLIQLTGELEQAFFGQIGEASAAAAREPVAIAIANHGRELALRPCRRIPPWMQTKAVRSVIRREGGIFAPWNKILASVPPHCGWLKLGQSPLTLSLSPWERGRCCMLQALIQASLLPGGEGQDEGSVVRTEHPQLYVSAYARRRGRRCGRIVPWSVTAG